MMVVAVHTAKQIIQQCPRHPMNQNATVCDGKHMVYIQCKELGEVTPKRTICIEGTIQVKETCECVALMAII